MIRHALSVLLLLGATACGLADNERDEKNRRVYLNFYDKTFEAFCLGEYDLDGDGTPDIYLKTKGESPSTKAPLIMEIDQDIFLSEGDHGYISPHKKNPGEWNEARDYYYPIPTDDRSLTGGALTQNPGWNDGLDF